jgi:hypothetical protein
MAVAASASLLSSLGSYWRGSSGSCAGLEDEAEAEARAAAEERDTAELGAPAEHPAWPRFASVWGGDGATTEAAERKWRDRRAASLRVQTRSAVRVRSG